MGEHDVVIFEPFAFEIGQKLRINSGPRKGDWEVVGLTKHKVKLRCPITSREFEWARFCYKTEERQGVQWPQED